MVAFNGPRNIKPSFLPCRHLGSDTDISTFQLREQLCTWLILTSPTSYKRLKPRQFVQNIPFKYQLHLWQVINISNRLFHSFRGRMLDGYLESYKGNTKKKEMALKKKSWTPTMHESVLEISNILLSCYFYANTVSEQIWVWIVAHGILTLLQG